MATKGLSQLSGKVRVRGFSRLDSDRYTFLSLDQAEPNVGLPADSGGLFQSALDGTRSLTKSISINEIIYEANQLDSVVGGNERFVIGILDPTARNPLGIISIRELLGDSGLGVDTLQSVTNRGDSTSLAITTGGLSLTRADSVPSSTAILVRNLLTDSVGVRSFGSLAEEAGLIQQGDLINAGGLTLTADSSNDNTVLTIDLVTDSVGKRSFQSLADEAGLVQQGDPISAGGLSLTVADSNPDTNQVLVLDLLTDSVGIRAFDDLAGEAGLIAQGDDIGAGGLTISQADSDSDTNQVLVIDLDTDSVGKRSFNSLATEAGLIAQGDDINAGGLTISQADSDSDTNQVLVINLDTDSVGKRSFNSLATEAGLIAQGDDINAGGLTISQADSDSDTNQVLVIDLDTDSVGKRSFNSLATEAGLIAQGDDINAGGLTISQADSDSDTNQVLVINLDTDSVGKRSFNSLATEAGLIAQGDDINAGGLTISQADSDPDTNQILVLNLDTDSVGIRTFASLAEEANIGADTLQSVTELGDSTSLPITIAGLSITNLDSGEAGDQLLVLDLATDSVGIRDFADLVEEAGLGQDTLQTVTDRGDSTDNAITLKSGLLTPNLPVNDVSTNVLVLTADDSVAQRTFASLAATEADTLQDVMLRGDSTTIDMTINGASLTADSVKANVGFFDTNNNQLIIYDSAGAVLWGS